MSKVKFNFSKKINPKEKEEKGVPLVVTYHSSLNCLSKIIRDNLYLLCMNDEVKKVFSLKPMISFRSARKLSSYLVRLNSTLLIEQLDHLNIPKNAVKYAKMLI